MEQLKTIDSGDEGINAEQSSEKRKQKAMVFVHRTSRREGPASSQSLLREITPVFLLIIVPQFEVAHKNGGSYEIKTERCK